VIFSEGNLSRGEVVGRGGLLAGNGPDLFKFFPGRGGGGGGTFFVVSLRRTGDPDEVMVIHSEKEAFDARWLEKVENKYFLTPLDAGVPRGLDDKPGYDF